LLQINKKDTVQNVIVMEPTLGYGIIYNHMTEKCLHLRSPSEVIY